MRKLATDAGPSETAAASLPRCLTSAELNQLLLLRLTRVSPFFFFFYVSCVFEGFVGCPVCGKHRGDEILCLQVYMATFAISGYAASYYRAAGKPFNPVLGETYECDRPDKGFRFIAEQVCPSGPKFKQSCSVWCTSHNTTQDFVTLIDSAYPDGCRALIALRDDEPPPPPTPALVSITNKTL